jgi:site-specific DNA-cytosine methylase
MPPDVEAGLRLMDLFAGIGGMTCGFVEAKRGFEPVFAVEIEETAAEVYRVNFGDHIHVGDIAQATELPGRRRRDRRSAVSGILPLGRGPG